MLGCIGTAPDTGVPTTFPAGPHGGNMDIIETCPGNMVYLPVFVPGGYLYLGDAHAAMGHGELSASGLEMPAETTITVDLLKGNENPRPADRVADRDHDGRQRLPDGTVDRRSVRPADPLDGGRLRLGPLAGLRPAHARGRISVGYYALGTVAVKVAKEFIGGPRAPGAGAAAQ